MNKMKKKRKYQMSTENAHKLLPLVVALEYQLKRAEETRKEIAKLKLKVLV
jgi:hypothetical protein